MEVKEIKTIHDVVLAWNNRQCLIDNNGNIFAIEYVRLIPNVGYKVMYQAGNNRYAMDFNDAFIKAFKVILAIDMDKQDLTSTNYINENKKENNNKTETNLKVNNMEGYIERMIQEHKELVPRIQKLHNWVYGDAYKTVEPHEFANECVQLKAMKVYEEALRARLFNAGVTFDNGQYLVAVDEIGHETEDTADKD